MGTFVEFHSAMNRPQTTHFAELLSLSERRPSPALSRSNEGGSIFVKRISRATSRNQTLVDGSDVKRKNGPLLTAMPVDAL